MQDKKLANISRAVLIFSLCFGAFCTLCFSYCSLSNAFMGPLKWLEGSADSLLHGHLEFNGMGLAFFILGFSIVGILSLLAFIFAFFAYRRRETGKKPMMWTTLLFGVALLMAVGSFTLLTHSSCYESPEGSDDTTYCTYALPGSQPLTPVP